MAAAAVLGYSRRRATARGGRAQVAGASPPIYLTTGGWNAPDADAAGARGGYPTSPGRPARSRRQPDLTWTPSCLRAPRAVVGGRRREHGPHPRGVPGLRHHMTPGVEVAYQPLAIASPLRRGNPHPRRRPFMCPLDVAHLGGAVAKGWAVTTTARAGAGLPAVAHRRCRTSMDQGAAMASLRRVQLAGAAAATRRYDYRRWDGYSADLTPCRVMGSRADNGYTTSPASSRTHSAQPRKFFWQRRSACAASLAPHPASSRAATATDQHAGGHLSAVRWCWQLRRRVHPRGRPRRGRQ